MTVKYFATIRDLTREIIIFVNGRNVRHLQMLDTPLKDDDEVAVFPMIAGG
jgi:molybdopterin synthase sulfur carrier subunit